MALELEGRVKYIGPIITGESARGQWKKRAFVISTLEQYPRDVAFIVWNERAEALDNLKVGQRVLVRFRLESRQHPQDQSRWFTDATAWAIKVIREEDVVAGDRQSDSKQMGRPAKYSSAQPEPFQEIADSETVDLHQDEAEDLMDEEEVDLHQDDVDDLMDDLEQEQSEDPTEHNLEDFNQEMDIEDPDIFDKEQEDDLPF